MSLASEPVIAKTIPAITHAAVPKEIRVTTVFISELLFKSTKEAYKRWR